MTLDAFLDLVHEKTGVHPRQSGGRYKARCPAHDDREPSLSIWESEEGWIKLKCHAGCADSDVVLALGLENKDLRTQGVNYSEPEATYTYTDEQGNALFQAVRFPGKRFRQRHLSEGEWVWDLDGVRRVIYRLPEIIKAIKQGRFIFVVEGEKDADRLWDAGVPATCNPMGAGKWREEYAELLRGAKVVIVADRDEVGRTHARTVRDSLQGIAEEVYIVQAKTGKDASDHLNAGHLVSDFIPMRERHRRGLITSRELAEQAIEELSFTASDVPAYQPWTYIPEIVLRQGRYYAIGAYTGDGKTSNALPAFRKFSEEGNRCGYFTLEMPERDIKNKLLQHEGIPLRVLEEPYKIRGSEWEESYVKGVEKIAGWQSDVIFDSGITSQRIQEITVDREYDVVFVDHLHRFAYGADRAKLNEQVNLLTNLALEQNIVLVVLCQLRKFSRGQNMEVYPRPLLQDFRETAMIGDDASMALAVWRQRGQDGHSLTGTTEVIILKNRHVTGPHDAQGKIFYPHFDPTRSMFTAHPVGEQSLS